MLSWLTRSLLALGLSIALVACGDDDGPARFDAGQDAGGDAAEAGMGADGAASDAASSDASTSGDGSCLPYMDAEACAMGTWCRPIGETVNRGSCAPGGAASDGDACEEDEDCAAGLICAFARCARVCDPFARAGAPGAICAESEACFRLTLALDDGGVQPLQIGTCDENCDFDNDMPCEDPTKTCAPRELFFTPNDVCIELPDPLPEEHSDCETGEPTPGICGPTSLCANLPELEGNGFKCYDVCRTVVGEFNSTSHPDCRRSDAVCRNLLGNSIYGVCD